ncbi:MAG TPA: glycoside hydrolase family 28 protein [Chitinophagaceae bacterium]
MKRNLRSASIMFVFLLNAAVGIAQDYYNVMKYGAKNDSSAIATRAIASAINAAYKKGGGTVYFPAGKYLTGPIHLKSNITIYIDAGAELHFSDNFDHYLPMVPSRWEGTDVTNFSPFFYAYKAENIAIRGRGLINGHGKKWWDFSEGYNEKNPRSKWQLEFDRLNKDILRPDLPGWVERGFLRPPFIQPMYCKNVLIEGITIINSPFWTVNPEFCENVTITGVTINNPESPNTDGINPESCRYVHISDCHISVGDDCITIKSGKDRAGRKMATPAENYTIINCTMLSGHGGVVIGSEMSGGVKKITISNCIFDGTDRGIRIKTARGRGGVVEDIRVDNIIMKNIRDQAIVLDMQYARTDPEPVSERTPQFRNIHFSNITAHTKQAVFLNGLVEMPIEDISFNDMQFDAQTGITIKEAKNISFHNVRVTTKEGPALIAENVQDMEIAGVKSLTPLNGVPLLSFTNMRNLFLYNCFPAAGTDIFLSFKGKETKDITIKYNNLKNVQRPLIKDESVPVNITVE